MSEHAHYDPDKNVTEVDLAGGSRIYDPEEIERLTALVAQDGIDVVCFVFDKDHSNQWYIVTGDGVTYGAVYSLNPGCLLITVLEAITRDGQRPEGTGAEETMVVPDGPDSFSGSLMFVRKDNSDVENFIKEMGNEQPPE